MNRCKMIAAAMLAALFLALCSIPASATFLVADRVRQTSTTSGTGTLTLNSPAVTDRSFASAIGAGNTTYYVIDDGAGNWEIGLGTVGSSTLARTTVILSSNSNTLVNFPAGSKTVVCAVPASRFLYMQSVLSPSNGDPLIYDGGWTNNAGSTALATARGKLGAVATTRAITAGTGLTGGGDFSADRSFTVTYGTTSGTAAQGNDSRITSAVPNTRQVIAGTGLSGGGALSADRTLAVTYGTTSGTAAQGNDSRITSAVPNTRQVIAGTGLDGGGTLAADRTLSVTYGTSSGTAAQGNDSRITGAMQKSANGSDIPSVPTFRTNTGLAGAAGVTGVLKWNWTGSALTGFSAFGISVGTLARTSTGVYTIDINTTGLACAGGGTISGGGSLAANTDGVSDGGTVTVRFRDTGNVLRDPDRAILICG